MEEGSNMVLSEFKERNKTIQPSSWIGPEEIDVDMLSRRVRKFTRWWIECQVYKMKMKNVNPDLWLDGRSSYRMVELRNHWKFEQKKIHQKSKNVGKGKSIIQDEWPKKMQMSHERPPQKRKRPKILWSAPTNSLSVQEFYILQERTKTNKQR